MAVSRAQAQSLMDKAVELGLVQRELRVFVNGVESGVRLTDLGEKMRILLEQFGMPENQEHSDSVQ